MDKNKNIIIKYLDTDDFTKEDVDFSLEIIKNNNLINKDRLNKIYEYTNDISKKQEILASILLINNLKNKARYIYFNKKEKPLLDDICFNLSHSKNYVLYVSSEDKIGVDIEEIDIKNIDILNYAFTKDEIDYIKKEYATDNIKEGIIKLWTIKEAVYKASGVIDKVEPKDIIINIDNMNEIVFFNEKYHVINKKYNNFYISIASKIKYDDFILEKDNILEV